jgi:HD superfamily phosphohydrolase
MQLLKYIALVGLGVSLLVGADTVEKKTHVPAFDCEIAAILLLGLGLALSVLEIFAWIRKAARPATAGAALFGRKAFGWVRKLVRAPLVVRELEARIKKLGIDHSEEVQALRRQHTSELEQARREWRDEKEKLQSEVTRLEGELLRRLPTRGKELASVWLTKSRQRADCAFLHRDDPIYGELVIDEKLTPVLSHPLIQRLNHIRQLSFAYLTFPSGSHSRLSHVLGAAKKAQEAVRKIASRGWAYQALGRGESPEGYPIVKVGDERLPLGYDSQDPSTLCLKAQLCALLHDVGHGPFGHALDKLVAYLPPIDRTDPPDTLYSLKYVVDYLGEEIRQVGFDPDNLITILDKDKRKGLTGFDVLIADLIASPVDIDRMDYLVRDGHVTGLARGHVNTEALLEHMYPLHEGSDYKLLYGEPALCHMEDLAQAHHMMYINCYEHPRKVASERLLIRAAAWLLDNGLGKDDLMLLTDDQLLTLLSEFLPAATMEENYLKAIQHNRNFVQVAQYRVSLWDAAKKEVVFAPGLSTEVKNWHDDRTAGKRFLKRAYIETPKSWEEQICDTLRLPRQDGWKVVVSVPAYEARLPGESGADVLLRHGPELWSVDFYDASPILRNIVNVLLPERNVLRLLVSEDLEPRSQELREAADVLFRR